jgi:hypothetical protein
MLFRFVAPSEHLKCGIASCLSQRAVESLQLCSGEIGELERWTRAAARNCEAFLHSIPFSRIAFLLRFAPALISRAITRQRLCCLANRMR